MARVKGLHDWTGNNSELWTFLGGGGRGQIEVSKQPLTLHSGIIPIVVPASITLPITANDSVPVLASFSHHETRY